MPRHYPAFFDRTEGRAGFSAFFGAWTFGSSLAVRLPLIGNSISRWPATALRGFLPVAFEEEAAFGAGAACRSVARLRFNASIRLMTLPLDLGAVFAEGVDASAFLVDEIDQRGFIVVLERIGLERSRFLFDDMLGEIQHVLGDFHVLDVFEIFLLAAHFVGIAQQRAHQALVERFQRDDVFAVGQHDTADRDLVHAADSFADHRERIMTDLAVRHEIIGADQIAVVDIGFGTNSSISMVWVDSSAISSSSSFDTSI